VALSRGLRRAGLVAESRAALQAAGERDAGAPEVELENALADLRDGPPSKALPRLAKLAGSTPEASWRYAEALFYAGGSDSAQAWFQRISADPADPWAGASLERLFLLEDADPREALPAFGRMAWEEWRGEPKRALALADSLSRGLARGALWAHATFELSRQREQAGDPMGALAASLAIADSLPDDRLAPRARQRAGDLLLDKLNEPARAMAQYEECLARYPRAWNAPEVRRKLELLRRPRRTST
jgi:tetratricopeptide (TPR) repeat protein